MYELKKAGSRVKSSGACLFNYNIYVKIINVVIIPKYLVLIGLGKHNKLIKPVIDASKHSK